MDEVLELVSFITVNLVDHPDDVLIQKTERQGREVFQVRVHPEDLGKVIGKGGQTARAIRTLLMAISTKTDRRLGLEILE
ncbi:MAG: KH domain-containing protein [bacterium]